MYSIAMSGYLLAILNLKRITSPPAPPPVNMTARTSNNSCPNRMNRREKQIVWMYLYVVDSTGFVSNSRALLFSGRLPIAHLIWHTFLRQRSAFNICLLISKQTAFRTENDGNKIMHKPSLFSRIIARTGTRSLRAHFICCVCPPVFTLNEEKKTHFDK